MARCNLGEQPSSFFSLDDENESLVKYGMTVLFPELGAEFFRNIFALDWTS